METIKCTTFTQDSQLRAAIAAVLEKLPDIDVVRGLNGCPASEDLIRFFQTSPARVVFLDVRDPDALKVSGEMELHDPGLQFISVGEPPESNVQWLGIQERLSFPLDPVALKEALGRRVRVLEKLPHRSRKPTSFISFLPAKAGAGTTTLACGLADILSATHKTLLCDFDLATGTVGFRYRLERPHSLPEVAEDFDHMDEHLWAQVVSRSGNLDVLPSSLRPGARLRVDLLPHWFDLLRATYDVVIFDLSGQMESHSLEIMKVSRQIFLVTTQELECLHLGRMKADALRQAGLHDQTSVLMNRVQKNNTLKRTDVEELLQMTVKAEFPNDYQGVQDSIRAGTTIKKGTPLCKALTAFAPSVNDAMERETKSHKFIEFVNLPVFSYWRRPDSRSERWT
jgi:MinD-like ATPase involved in chromosome partitioning or flagellar assembly